MKMLLLQRFGFGLTWILLTCFLTASPVFSSGGAHEAQLIFDGAAGATTKRAVFLTGENPTLQFTLISDTVPFFEPDCEIEILDFWNRIIELPKTNIQNQGRRIIMTARVLTQRYGWYHASIKLRDANGPWTLKREVAMDDAILKKGIAPFSFPMFCIVSDPSRYAGSNTTALGVDAAISALTDGKDANQLKQIELLTLTGTRWVRDRISWGRSEPRSGDFDFVRAKQNADALHSRGIQVLQTFNGSPVWSHSDPNASFPDDLRVAYRFAREAGKALSPGVSAWEIWNEPDIAHFCKETPDAYAALVKAMALGFRAASPALHLQLGPFARDPNVGNYAEILFANQVSPYVDGYSFHTYAPLTNGLYERVLKTHLAVADAGELSSKARWLTETAIGFRKANPPAADFALKEQIRHLFGAVTEALSNGVRPIFWFLLRPYYGSDVQFGMIDTNQEPFPIFPALAAMNQLLGEGLFIDRSTLDGAPAFHFSNGGKSVTLVLSSNQTTTLGLDANRAVECFDAMGNLLSVEQISGAVVVPNNGWPFYIRDGAPSADTSRFASDAAPNQDVSPVIIHIRYPRTFVALDENQVQSNWDGIASRWAPRAYNCQADQSVPVVAEVYNFGEQSVTGMVSPALPSGVSATPSSQSYSIAPGERALLTFAVQTHADLQPLSQWKFELFDHRGRMIDRSVSQWARR